MSCDRGGVHATLHCVRFVLTLPQNLSLAYSPLKFIGAMEDSASSRTQQRLARGVDIPAGTLGQEKAAMKCFAEFQAMVGLDAGEIEAMHQRMVHDRSMPTQNLYSLLSAFAIFLQTKKSTRSRSADGMLSKATALGYFSQLSA